MLYKSLKVFTNIIFAIPILKALVVSLFIFLFFFKYLFSLNI